jgi:tripartite-type tricarboxylate transporter receptor subunit TctC
MNFKPATISLAAAATFAAAVLPASAQDFYKGKTLSIIVGFSPGGLYDLTARVLARHLGDHIPGKPKVIVQTMTGAGGTSFAAAQLRSPTSWRNGSRTAPSTGSRCSLRIFPKPSTTSSTSSLRNCRGAVCSGKDYQGTMLRDHLGLAKPPNRFASAP